MFLEQEIKENKKGGSIDPPFKNFMILN